ncbi:MAG: hypothetical protein JWQ66_323 [Mucilaginibacter sp.]|jgi:hypothetical protein|nr:hypothetical protein [Mucilaginibacter sp.]
MEKENNQLSEVTQSIIETHKLMKANNEATVANAHRQTDILEVQTNLYRNTLLLVGVNLIIGLGILITTFISYTDKKEIATLHAQLRDRDEQIRMLQTKANPAPGDGHTPMATKIDTNK